MTLYTVTVWHAMSTEIPKVYVYRTLGDAVDHFPPSWWAERQAEGAVHVFKELPGYHFSVRQGKHGEWITYFREHEVP